MTAQVSHASRPVGTERRPMMLLEALRWAYSRQMVDVVTGKRLSEGEPRERHGASADGIAHLLRIKALGCRVDGGRGSGGADFDCHPDAETIHDAVLSLGDINARLVVEFGYTGMHPQPSTPKAQPCPASPGIENVVGDVREVGDRVGHGLIDGVRTFFRIAVAEVVVTSKPVYRKVGRGKLQLSHFERTRHEVEYCPVTWWPDPVWCEAVNGIHAHWLKVLGQLSERLQDAPFGYIQIVDLERNSIALDAREIRLHLDSAGENPVSRQPELERRAALRQRSLP